MDVLLVEDNAINVLVARRLLERLGCRVTTVGDGRLAVEAHAEHAYDLICMDIQMPEMDGVQAASAIRARERSGSTRTPIIALTAHTLQSDRERCQAAGMEGFVTKQVSEQALKGRDRARAGRADRLRQAQSRLSHPAVARVRLSTRSVESGSQTPA